MDNLVEVSGLSPESHKNRLEWQLQQLRQKEAVSKILYDQLLEAYNNLHKQKGNRSNQISLLVQLHEQQKAKLRVEMQEEIESRLSQYGQILDQLNEARQARHQAQTKQLLYQNLLQHQKSQHYMTSQRLSAQLEQLQSLNRQLKDNQQVTLNRMISQHSEELQLLKSKHGSDLQNQQQHFQNILRINKHKFQQSLTSCQQQRQIQLQANTTLEQSAARLQSYLAEFQQKHILQVQQLTTKLHDLQEANQDLLRQNMILNQSNYELREGNKMLEVQNEQLRAGHRRLVEEWERQRRKGERELTKERSVSERLRKEVEIHEKQLKSRNSEQKRLITMQREKEKQLLQSLSGVKTKYQRQHNEMMHRLLFLEKQRKQKKIHKTQSHRNIGLDASLHNQSRQDSTCKMLPDLSDMPSTVKHQQSFLSTRHPTFQNNFKDQEAQNSPLKEVPTSRKRQVKHLRIHSDLQTVRQPDFKPEIRWNVQTPCFQTSSRATASKPSRKINIRLRK